MFTVIVYTIIIALFVPGPAATSPLPNATAEHRFEPPFKPNPTGRGTMDLLMNTTITLVLAIWTVIHPNIIEDPTMLRSLRNKGFSVLTALLAPELILAQAYREWWEAKELVHDVLLATKEEILGLVITEGKVLLTRAESKEADGLEKGLSGLKGTLEEGQKALEKTKPNDATGPQNTPPTQKEVLDSINNIRSAHRHLSEILHLSKKIKNTPSFFKPLVTMFVKFQGWVGRVFGECQVGAEIEFTMEDAFFVQMNGYTFSLAGYPRDQDRTFVIDRETLIKLLEAGVLSASKLSSLRNDVSDRSKADALAKLLVCLQAGWMVVNCICRVASNLPVTLLELNVLAHVVFAVLMYGFWWKKPHNVRQPISLSPVFLDKYLCAYLFMKSVSIHMEKVGQAPRTFVRSFTLFTGGQETRYCIDHKHGKAVPHIRRSLSSDQGQTENIGYDEDLSILVPAEVRDYPPSLRQYLFGLSQEPIHVYDTTNGYRLTAFDPSPYRNHKRLCLTKRDLRTATLAVAEHQDPRYRYLKVPSSGFHSFRPQESVHYSALALARTPLRFTFSFTMCYAIYFAIHTSAWNTDFPSPAERLLWRISCGFLAAGLLLVWFYNMLAFLLSSLGPSSVKRIGKILSKPFREVRGGLKGRELFGIRGTYKAGVRKNKERLAESRPLLVKVRIIATWLKGIIQKVVVVVVGAVAILPVVLYIASRAYIIIECFLIIRKLPEGSFKTVPWEDFWPHL